MNSTTAEPRKEALVVLGMHRSGTSAMARVLSLSGASLPINLLGSNHSNPNGHWEPQDIIEFNDKILADLDVSWDDIFGPRRRRDGTLPTAKYLKEARNLIGKNWPNEHFIVFKEPRVSLLIELWRDALQSEGFRPSFIIMVRHPLEVADSLKSRDGFNRNKSLMLWSNYMLSAELATRNYRRTFIRFDELIDNPEDVLNRIENSLDVILPRRTLLSASEAESFLKSEDRHHVRSSNTGLQGFKPVEKFYQFLQDAAQGAIWNEDVSKNLSEWLVTLEQTVGPVFTELSRDLRGATLEISSERERVAALEASKLADHAKVASLLAELQTVHEDLRAREADFADARHHTHAALEAKADLERRLVERSAELEDSRHHTHAALEAKADLERRFAEQSAELADARNQAQVAFEAKAELENQLEALSNKLALEAEARAGLEANLTETSSATQIAVERNAQLEAQLTELSHQLNEAAHVRSTLEVELSDAKASAEAALKAKMETADQIAALAEKLEVQKHQELSLREQIAHLRENYDHTVYRLSEQLKESELEVRAKRISEGEARIALTLVQTKLSAREESLTDELNLSEAARKDALQKALELEQVVKNAQAEVAELERARQRDLQAHEILRTQSAKLAKALSETVSNSGRVDRLSVGALQWRVVKRLLGRPDS